MLCQLRTRLAVPTSTEAVGVCLAAASAWRSAGHWLLTVSYQCVVAAVVVEAGWVGSRLRGGTEEAGEYDAEYRSLSSRVTFHAGKGL